MVTYLETNSRSILIKLLLSYFATKPFPVLQDKEILLDKPVRCKHLTNRFHFDLKVELIGLKCRNNKELLFQIDRILQIHSPLWAGTRSSSRDGFHVNLPGTITVR